ncbi:MAG: hypothetical protein C5B60_04345 [Chloroflexi bacterium]|nr:MAG: hypothetical protein C5B60_04345 [Chloroflexota bacterium]
MVAVVTSHCPTGFAGFSSRLACFLASPWQITGAFGHQYAPSGIPAQEYKQHGGDTTADGSTT